VDCLCVGGGVYIGKVTYQWVHVIESRRRHDKDQLYSRVDDRQVKSIQKARYNVQ
jgi:hypothetical protein